MNTQKNRPGLKTILQYGTWTLVLVALVLSLGFVSRSEKEVLTDKLDIAILNNEENLFLSEGDVSAYLTERYEALEGRKLSAIDLPRVEQLLNEHPAVENAEVAGSYNGEIHITVAQRNPILRVMNRDGESYYLDDRSRLMPLSEKYTAQVMVANGYLFEPYDRRYVYPVEQMAKSKTFRDFSKLDDLYAIATYVNADSLLSRLIHQLYVNAEGDVELYPVYGCQRIIFGDTSAMKEKFAKLNLLYSKGMNRVNGWELYSTLNLKYKNMVVCTKK